MTFAPVRDAYRMWLQTAPQLTLEVDDLTKFEEPVRVALASPGHRRPLTTGSSKHIGAGTNIQCVPGDPLNEKGREASCSGAHASEGRPAPTPNNEGRSGSPVRESTAAATGGEV